MSTRGSTCSSSSTPRPPSPGWRPSTRPATCSPPRTGGRWTRRRRPAASERRGPRPVRHQRAGARRTGRHDRAVRSFADLDDPGVDYLTCVATAPCGAAARALLGQDGIQRRPVSEEVDVKAVVTKVAAGEADAGLVYRTDVVASRGKVVGVDIPGAEASPNTYWAAVTADARDGRLAASWIRFITGTRAARSSAAPASGSAEMPRRRPVARPGATPTRRRRRASPRCSLRCRSRRSWSPRRGTGSGPW